VEGQEPAGAVIEAAKPRGRETHSGKSSIALVIDCRRGSLNAHYHLEICSALMLFALLHCAPQTAETLWQSRLTLSTEDRIYFSR
jgi:hypothetical protein